MGRNRKTGLDYFPFDIDTFQDIKIRKLIKYQSGKAVTVYALLLCLIYKGGYYMRWDEELPFIISEQTGFEEAYIQEVIKSCMVLGLFSKELFESEYVITSKGIQERYRDICKQMNRKCDFVEFSLISSEEKAISSEEIPISSEEIPISSEEMLINSEKIPQKKRKEKEINNPPAIPPLGGGDAVADAPDASETADVKIGDDTKTWRNDYATYLKLVEEAKNALLQDREMMAKQQSYYPGVNIPLSIEKACTNFWATEAGWKNKKGKRSKDINMKMTLVNAIKSNRVYETKTEHKTTSYDNGDFLR